jgi:apolipoprotein N-acyltransferase
VTRGRQGGAAPLLVAAACGALLTLALPPTGAWPALAALAGPFAAIANARSGRRAFGVGFWAGLPFFVIYLAWLPASLSDLLGPAFWGVFPLLVLALSCFWGATGWLTWLASGGGGRRTLWFLPVAWVAVEWLRTQGYLAFPWGTLGYAWLDTPVAQLASVGGVYLLSLVSTAAAALLALPLVSPRTTLGPPTYRLLLAPAGALLTVAAAWAGGLELGAAAEAAMRPATRLALLVQGNVDAFGRASGAARDLQTHLELTRGAVAEARATGAPPYDLVVWPEGAVIGYQVGGADSDALRQAIAETAPGASFVVGGRAYEAEGSYNSLFSLAPGGELLGRYDKHYLVPFGERWPLHDTLPGLYDAVFRLFNLPPLASTAAGQPPQPLPTALGAVSAFVCYESVFPQVQRAQVAAGARLLVLGTNDAWFARGAGAAQHFDMGRVRAIETRRWLVRAGNDGVTAAVDPLGRTVTRLDRGVAGTLAAPFALEDSLTPWVRFGHLTPIALGAYLLVAMVALQAARPRSGGRVADRLRRR